MKEIDLEKENIHKIFFSYAMPSVIAVAVFSLYTLTDSIFVSRYCGADALSAVELCMPVLAVFSCISVIIGTGGNALMGIAMGKKEDNKVKELFTFISIVVLLLSVVFSIGIIFFSEPISFLLGADKEIVAPTVDYLKICGYFATPFLMSGVWGMCLETAGKPVFAMIGQLTMALGNIAADYLLIVKFHLGIKGAALASALSATVATLIFLTGFLLKDSKLKFKKFHFDFKLLFQMLFNGASEGISIISSSLIAYIYNLIIMKVGGSDILAAFSVTLAIINFFGAIIAGASEGISPVISVNFGAGNQKRVNKAVKIFIIYELLLGLIITVVFISFSTKLLSFFKPGDTSLTKRIAFAYLPMFFFSPVCSIITSFFTAINDAKMSAFLSVLRVLIIRAIVIALSFLLFKLEGIWYSAAISEFLAMIVGIFLYKKGRKKIF